MRTVFPGLAEARPESVSAGQWRGRTVAVYISGVSIAILARPDRLIQTLCVQSSTRLRAISFDSVSGKIAAISATDVFLFAPTDSGSDAGDGARNTTRWRLDSQATAIMSDGDLIDTISWGTDDELLVGGSRLTLFNTHLAVTRAWSAPVAAPVKTAVFSSDGSLIATTGRCDRLVKMWHLLGTGLSDQRFDISYLAHPGPVTAVQWRRPSPGSRDGARPNVLYSIATDRLVRVWAQSGAEPSAAVFTCAAVIDLVECLQPRGLGGGDSQPDGQARYAFIIDSSDFGAATDAVVGREREPEAADDTLVTAADHLAEIAALGPDVCFVLDGAGNMSAWGITGIGSAVRVFNIAHAERVGIRLGDRHVGFSAFARGSRDRDGRVSVLVHIFGGPIKWFDCPVDRLVGDRSGRPLFELQARWTGHSGPVKKVVRTGTGRAAISRTAGGEAIMWTVADDGDNTGQAVRDRSRADVTEPIVRICVLRDGDFVVFLHPASLSLWDCRAAQAEQVSRVGYVADAPPVSLLVVPDQMGEDGPAVHLATIWPDKRGIGWRVRLPGRNGDGDKCSPSLCRLGDFVLDDDSDMTYILPVDPAGMAPHDAGVFDSSARDVALSYNQAGLVKTWSGRVDSKAGTIDWFNTATVDSRVANPAIASGTSIRKVALVDHSRTGLTIWSSRTAQLEHREQFETGNEIVDLDWSWTPDGQSILSVGFGHSVLLYSQLRYDYLDATPAWTVIRQVSTVEATPSPIGDSVWLTGGRMLVGVGNMLLVEDGRADQSRLDLVQLGLVDRDHPTVDIYSVARRLNGPVPIFHPQFLAQCVLAAKFGLVNKVILRLHKSLCGEHAGYDSDGDVAAAPATLISDDGMMLDIDNRTIWHPAFVDRSADLGPVTARVADELSRALRKGRLSLLSDREQAHLADLVSSLGVVGDFSRSLDDDGARFFLFFRQHLFAAARLGGHSPAPSVLSRILDDRDDNGYPRPRLEPVPWRDVVWATLSRSQDVLIDLVRRHFEAAGEPVGWAQVRQAGVAYWLTQPDVFRRQIELVAATEFSRSAVGGGRNPVYCALFYIALGKKDLLLGLWRAAFGHPEQAMTMKLLSNDFTTDDGRRIAAKNAYALLSKHRLEYSAALFILAGKLDSAVSVLVKNVGDVALAFAVARVHENGIGPVTTKLLRGFVLPDAARTGNRWQAVWAFWMLGERDKALRAIVEPVSGLLVKDETGGGWADDEGAQPDLDSRLFTAADPALAVLYANIRSRSLHALSSAVPVTGPAEAGFVLGTANTYVRMGCDWLAVDLVRNWSFVVVPVVNGGKRAVVPVSPEQARKMLGRRASTVVDDLPVALTGLRMANARIDEVAIEDADEAGGKKKKGKSEENKAEEDVPTMFEEPDGESFLKSFGF